MAGTTAARPTEQTLELRCGHSFVRKRLQSALEASQFEARLALEQGYE